MAKRFKRTHFRKPFMINNDNVVAPAMKRDESQCNNVQKPQSKPILVYFYGQQWCICLYLEPLELIHQTVPDRPKITETTTGVKQFFCRFYKDRW
jgi:hypothetical protein